MYVAENKYGLRSELIKTIGMESYNHLCLSGIISETFANGKPCWRCAASRSTAPSRRENRCGMHSDLHLGENLSIIEPSIYKEKGSIP